MTGDQLPEIERGEARQGPFIGGKVVRHKSGLGPAMVAVEKRERDAGPVTWTCSWFDRLATGQHEVGVSYFRPHELEIYEKKPAPVPGPSRADS